MSDLLALLREEGTTLADHELPSAEEVRRLFSALVNRVERLELDVAGELKAAPPAEPAVDPAIANQVEPSSYEPPVTDPPVAESPVTDTAGENTQAQDALDSELAAARARVQALEQRRSEPEQQARVVEPEEGAAP